MKMVSHYSLRRIFFITLLALIFTNQALPQRISELPPASYIGVGDLTAIVQNGVTKKLPYSALIGSLHFFSDSIYVSYRCHKIKGISNWYFSGDTVFIDTCSVQIPPAGDSCLFYLRGDTIWNKNGYKVMFDDSVYFMRDAIKYLEPLSPLGGFLTLGKLDATGRRQLVMSTFRNVSIEGIKIPLVITDTNYYSTTGSESVSFWDLRDHNDTLFLGSAVGRLNDMIFVARTGFYDYAIVINSASGIYYKSRSYWNMKLNKSMTGAILQSNGTDWYVIGVFNDQYSSETMIGFPDSTTFSDNIRINSSIHAPNLDSASTNFQLFIDPVSGLFSYSLAVAPGPSDTIPDLILIDPTPNADSSATGTGAIMEAGESLIFGNLCYLGTNGKLFKCDADTNISIPGEYLCIEPDGITINNSGRFLREGYVRNDSWSWTTGGQNGIIYASVTAGSMSQTAPTASLDWVQAIGTASSENVIHFKPEKLIFQLE